MATVEQGLPVLVSRNGTHVAGMIAVLQRVAVLPTNATAPVLETLRFGLASTSPRSSFFAAPLSSVLPVASYVVPLRSHLLPTGDNPVSGSALRYPSSGYPDVCAAIPLPMSCAPNVAVARRRSVLDPIRRRRSIGNDVAACRNRFVHHCAANA